MRFWYVPGELVFGDGNSVYFKQFWIDGQTRLMEVNITSRRSGTGLPYSRLFAEYGNIF